MHYAPDLLNFISKYETSHDQDREKDFTRKDKKSYNSLKNISIQSPNFLINFENYFED